MTQEPEPLNPNTPSPIPQQDAPAASSIATAITDGSLPTDTPFDSPASATMAQTSSSSSVIGSDSADAVGTDAVADEPIPPSIEPSYAPTGEERKARRASLAERTTPKFVAAKDDADAHHSPLVSVIVTVQDAAETVRFCVDSILRQSYANLEVILVDDGSLDDGPAILDEYAKRDDRVTTIFLKDGERAIERTPDGATDATAVSETDAPILGVPPVVIEKSDADKAADRDAERGDVAARARNAGLDAAHGEYVAFAGSDGVLDRRTIELLLHAIIKTGADMAKSRWERFTADQLYAVAETAAEGAHEPESVTVFTDALEAYQSVFLKSLRVLGDEFGHNTEARFLPDEDWGRLYRMSVWDGVRLPEGIYSPELLAAGELYSRMGKIADVDVVLYRWLRDDAASASMQSTDGDSDGGVDEVSGINGERAMDNDSTPNGTGIAPIGAAGIITDESGSEPGDAAETTTPRRFRYWHDTFTAGSANFRFAYERGILPARSYTTMVTAYEGAKTAPDFDEPESQRQFALDTAELEELRGMLTLTQRLQCVGVRRMRLFEEGVKRFLPSALSRSQYTPRSEAAES